MSRCLVNFRAYPRGSRHLAGPTFSDAGPRPALASEARVLAAWLGWRLLEPVEGPDDGLWWAAGPNEREQWRLHAGFSCSTFRRRDGTEIVAEAPLHGDWLRAGFSEP